MQSVGFKEWALVCEALGRGEQSILLRKGGIAEGRKGFGFRHSEFFLFPTFFHEQIGKVRTPDAQIPAAREGEIDLRYFAKLEASAEIISWPAAAALEPFHILEESVVRERFEYKGAGLHAAFVRVFRLEPAWKLADEPRYGGCKSWIDLPDCPAETRFEPVLSDREFQKIADKFPA
ncbi:MAG TPA: DUF1802 family protein [Chthoniobacterales bacterium]|nr:DUF1802 family protein [Chthoniobacterales bacterium]